MDDYVKNLISYRINKAQEELTLAKYCIEQNLFSKSLNCSYYAIFHSVRAVFAIEKKDFKKHSGVISYFIKNYVETGIFEHEMGKIIRTAERERNKGDYRDFFIVSSEEAQRQFAKAEIFHSKVVKFLSDQTESPLIN